MIGDGPARDLTSFFDAGPIVLTPEMLAAPLGSLRLVVSEGDLLERRPKAIEANLNSRAKELRG
jgi:hypothetical protein